VRAIKAILSDRSPVNSQTLFLCPLVASRFAMAIAAGAATASGESYSVGKKAALDERLRLRNDVERAAS